MPPSWPKRPEPLFAALRLPHFPAQALAAQNPRWRHQPFAVVEQNPESHKTHLTAVSQTARHQGVEAGMPAFIAVRRWRNLPVLSRDAKAEVKTREAISTLLNSYTPAFSLRKDGVALLDMAGTPCARTASPEHWARRLLAALTGLQLESMSLGVGASQVVAKVSAQLPSQGGLRICPSGSETAFLDPLSAECLPGLSPQARGLLRKYGLATIRQIRNLGREEIALRFGGESEKLFTLVQGLDYEIAAPRIVPLTAETVLSRDIHDEEALRGQLRLTADKLGHVLRQRECSAGRITLVLHYSDGRSLRKTGSLHPPTAAFLKLAGAAENLFTGLHQRRVALRRIRLEVTLPSVESGQIDLFDPESARKQEALARALDRIRRKRDFADVLNAGSLDPGSYLGSECRALSKKPAHPTSRRKPAKS